MVYNSLEHRTQCKTIVTAESGRKSDDGYFVRYLRGIEVFVRILDLTVEMGQESSVSLSTYLGEDASNKSICETHEGAAAWCASSTTIAFSPLGLNLASRAGWSRV